MAQLISKDRFSGILKTSTLLVFLGAFGLIVLGSSLVNINEDTKRLSLFLSSAQNIQTDFEKSLSMYTENTAQDVNYIHSLRPETELEYIEFISAIEDLAQDLGLSASLDSVELDSTSSNIQSDFVTYQITFYGGNADMIDFLAGMEGLPYYTHVDRIAYTSLNSIDFEESSVKPNITLTIKLYVK